MFGDDKILIEDCNQLFQLFTAGWERYLEIENPQNSSSKIK